MKKSKGFEWSKAFGTEHAKRVYPAYTWDLHREKDILRAMRKHDRRQEWKLRK